MAATTLPDIEALPKKHPIFQALVRASIGGCARVSQSPRLELPPLTPQTHHDSISSISKRGVLAQQVHHASITKKNIRLSGSPTERNKGRLSAHHVSFSAAGSVMITAPPASSNSEGDSGAPSHRHRKRAGGRGSIIDELLKNAGGDDACLALLEAEDEEDDEEGMRDEEPSDDISAPRGGSMLSMPRKSTMRISVTLDDSPKLKEVVVDDDMTIEQRLRANNVNKANALISILNDSRDGPVRVHAWLAKKMERHADTLEVRELNAGERLQKHIDRLRAKRRKGIHERMIDRPHDCPDENMQRQCRRNDSVKHVKAPSSEQTPASTVEPQQATPSAVAMAPLGGSERLRCRVCEVPRLRSRFRNEDRILGGCTSLEAPTWKRECGLVAKSFGVEAKEDLIEAMCCKTREDMVQRLELTAEKQRAQHRHSAASTIQRRWITWRNMRNVFAFIRVLRHAVRVLQTWFHTTVAWRWPITQRIQRRRLESRAATRIQAVWRGVKDRNLVASQKDLQRISLEMAKIQENLCGLNSVQLKMVQAWVRGFLARRRCAHDRARRAEESTLSRQESSDSSEEKAVEVGSPGSGPLGRMERRPSTLGLLVARRTTAAVNTLRRGSYAVHPHAQIGSVVGAHRMMTVQDEPRSDYSSPHPSNQSRGRKSMAVIDTRGLGFGRPP
mmetsp:Transcript_105850/g.225921  ORF Transcript_105850/g.225921 Transcript_105850/m.225921 type:complete len:673 (+) Transcript_105850:138-2156(+)